MELEIVNFKYLKRNNYKFDEKIYLLQGKSGQGKSTILDAICWVLFANIRNISPLNSKEKTIVVLTLDSIKITRSKNPEELCVVYREKKLRDDDAQNLINSIFNREELWMISTYIPQNKRNYFLECSTNDRLDIIKDLIFKEEQDIQYNAILEEKIKLLSSDIVNKQTIAKYLENEVKYLLDKNESYLDDYQEYKKQTDLLNKEERLLNALELLENKIINYQNQEEINKLIEIKNKEYSELLSKINEYPEDINLESIKLWQQYIMLKKELSKFNKNYTEEPEHIDDLLQQRTYAIRNKEITDYFKSSNIEQLIKIHKDSIEKYHKNNKIKEQRKILGVLEEEIDRIKICFIKYNKIWYQLITKLQLNDIIFNEYNATKIIEDHLDQNTKFLECPTCTQELILKNKKLYKGRDILLLEEKIYFKDIIIEMITLDKRRILTEERINIIEIELNDQEINPLMPIDIAKTEEDFVKLLQYEKGIDIIEINNKKIKYNKNYYNYQGILKKLKELKSYNFERYNIPENFNKYYNDYITIINKIKDIKKYLKHNFYIQVGNYDNEIKQKKIITEHITKLNIYKTARDKCLIIDTKKDELEKTKKELTEKIVELENHQKLLSLIKEAENEFMQSRISHLNTCLNEILETLFEDISINISMFKILKNGKEKPKVDINIRLNGKDYPNLNYFSGGEKDRISIALTLTFNIILGSKMILLDEVMSSLEASKREECLKIIRKYTNNKIVINVCHETIEGYYDELISL